jgi:hypothetical protein
MNQGNITRWLMIGAMGAGFVIGCDHGSRRVVLIETTQPSAGAVAASAGACAPAQCCEVPQPQSHPECVCSAQPSACQPGAVATRVEPQPLPANSSITFVCEGPETQTPTLSSQARLETPLMPAQQTQHMDSASLSTMRGEKRFESAEVTACSEQSHSGHAEDYGWICGEVSRDFKNRNTWRIRYLSVADTDRYGGALTVVPDARLECWKEGMVVKAWGHTIEGRERSENLAYRVERFEIVRSGFLAP